MMLLNIILLLLLLQKADKRALDNLVSRTKFDQSIGGLDQSLQELLRRLEAQVCSSPARTTFIQPGNQFFLPSCPLLYGYRKMY